MPILRRRLTCFYCGERSAQKQSKYLRQWQCENCEAVNYLDQNGDIADPPAPEAPAVQYAQAVPRAVSPELSSSDETLFCPTCIKNQHLVRENLAEYLPPPDDPRYDEYEASYDEYKRHLEQRYPQVCADCAPRVNKRIRDATYAAKTDHLRRMMELSKQGGSVRIDRSWGWRDLLILMGGLAWWASVLSQMAWDVSALLENSRREDGLRSEDPTPTLGECFQQAGRGYAIPSACLASITPRPEVALTLGFISIWWNNKLRQKLYTRGGRLIGLGPYIQFQVFMLAIRAGSWWISRDSGQGGLSTDVDRLLHMIMLLMMAVAIVISNVLVKIDYTPRVNWNKKLEPLQPLSAAAEPTQNQFSTANTNAVPLAVFKAQSPSYIKPFPINNLAPRRSPFPFESSSTTTALSGRTGFDSSHTSSTTEYDPDNEMEWTPTKPQPSFRPTQPLSNPFQPRPAQQASAATKSPFYGTLPPAPIAPAHKLRNPPNQPTFQRASASKQQDFFSKMMRPVSPDQNNLVDGQSRPGRTNLELADPKLRLREEPADTGLEAMFDSVFSIRDEPAEVRAAMEERANAVGEEGDRWKVVVRCLAALAVLVVAVGLKVLVDRRGGATGNIRVQEGVAETVVEEVITEMVV